MAAVNSSINTSLGVMKEYYSGAKLWDEIWENNPALSMLDKEDDTCGEYYDFTVKYAGSQGYAINFANALANQTPALYAQFHVPVSQMIGVSTIQNSALRAAMAKGPGAFESLLEGEVRSGIKDVTNQFAKFMFAGGTSTDGVIASTTTTTSGGNTIITVTLTSSLSYQFFEPGETVNGTASDGSAPLQTVSGVNDTATVSQIDGAAGILVLTCATAQAATFDTAGNCLIRDGNYIAPSIFGGNISSQSGQAAFTPTTVAGLGLWCPSAASRAAGVLNTSFCNVTRSADGTRLGGISVNATGLSVQNGLIQASRALTIFGHPGPYVAWMNPNTFASLAESLQAQRLYMGETLDGDGPISFDAIGVLGGIGKIKVAVDRNVPAFTTFISRPDAFRMVSMGNPFEMLEYPGMPGGYVWPLQDQDAVQIRFGGYPQLVVTDPTGIVNMTTSV